MALILAKEGAAHPTIIWSKREAVPFRRRISAEESFADLCSALDRLLRTCGSEGLERLAVEQGAASVSAVQVTIAAPWGQTVTQSVTTTRSESFSVTESLVGKMASKAEEMTQAALRSDANASAELTILNSETMAVEANGYALKEPFGVQTNEVTAVIRVELARTALVKRIRDGIERICPHRPLRIGTFVSLFYEVMRDLRIDTTDTCLFHVSAETTELGIIRNNLLSHATYTPYGTHSIAREIAELTNIPHSEALAYIRDEADAFQPPNAAALSEISELYRTNLVELIERAGGKLAGAKTVFLHADTRAETYLCAAVVAAMKRATGRAPSVRSVTADYFAVPASDDTAILLSAYALHRVLNGA